MHVPDFLQGQHWLFMYVYYDKYPMSQKSVIVQADIECQVQGPAPAYRAWLDQELFTERTWRFDSHQSLEEIWQIKSRPGRYRLRYELIGHGRLSVRNWQVLQGSAGITDQGELVIHDA